MYLHKTFQGQETAFVEDELLRLIDEYEETARNLGTDMVEGSLELLFDKDVVAGVTAGLASALVEQPVVAAVASTPILIKMGKISLEIRKKKRKLNTYRNNSPVAFLHDVKEKTSQ